MRNLEEVKRENLTFIMLSAAAWPRLPSTQYPSQQKGRSEGDGAGDGAAGAAPAPPRFLHFLKILNKREV